MKHHIITEADVARMQSDEMVETLVASGPSRDGMYKRIVARVRYDSTPASFVVVYRGSEAPYLAFADAVEVYNDL